jgi:hypothetical protein
VSDGLAVSAGKLIQKLGPAVRPRRATESDRPRCDTDGGPRARRGAWHPRRRRCPGCGCQAGDDEVRLRAGWVLSAVREGWDLGELLAERRTTQARLARWQAERVERERDTLRWRSRESLMGEWRGAISVALDDRQLATAVERVTTPVAGLGRRSVPIVRAQLVAWAVAAHRGAPTRPLPEALADDLVGTDRLVSAPSLEGPIPVAPGVGADPDDLTARLTDLLAGRADLAMPGPEAPERSHAGLRRSLADGLGRDR